MVRSTASMQLWGCLPKLHRLMATEALALVTADVRAAVTAMGLASKLRMGVASLIIVDCARRQVTCSSHSRTIRQ